MHARRILKTGQIHAVLINTMIYIIIYDSYVCYKIRLIHCLILLCKIIISCKIYRFLIDFCMYPNVYTWMRRSCQIQCTSGKCAWHLHKDITAVYYNVDGCWRSSTNKNSWPGPILTISKQLLPSHPTQSQYINSSFLSCPVLPVDPFFFEQKILFSFGEIIW